MKKDLSGTVFGKLTVLYQSQDSPRIQDRIWTCRCECGTLSNTRETHLSYGYTKSCGCLQKEHARKMFSGLNATHRMSRTKEYRAWCHAKERCCNPNNDFYDKYGGRGISMCVEWHDSFETFLSDMGPCPSPKHSIDRINVNGHYEPSNCRWATPVQQARNTRSTLRVNMWGHNYCIADWCDLLKLDTHFVNRRIRLGWNPIEALTIPSGTRRPKKE